MESKMSQINEILCKKSATKQLAYKITHDVFKEIKVAMQDMQTEILPCIQEDAPAVEIKYYDKGEFEAHFKFAGDTIVVMMHTNIFDFDENHYISKTRYVKEEPLREYCGLIQIYNFLSDSLRYNREQDSGYLIGRMFVNKERHFFIEGKRPLSFMYSDFEKSIVTKESLRNILEEAVLFCLHFDLQVPPVDSVNYLSVEQKNQMSYSSGMPTSKRLGFVMSSEKPVDKE
jgi:hypothetical protein